MFNIIEYFLYLKMIKAYVYLLSNKHNTVLYTGVTSNLYKRILQHKDKFYKGFTSKYNCDKLIYFEEYLSIKEAISREKQIKNYSRKKKNELVNSTNPRWEDLFYFMNT